MLEYVNKYIKGERSAYSYIIEKLDIGKYIHMTQFTIENKMWMPLDEGIYRNNKSCPDDTYKEKVNTYYDKEYKIKAGINPASEIMFLLIRYKKDENGVIEI